MSHPAPLRCPTRSLTRPGCSPGGRSRPQRRGRAPTVAARGAESAAGARARPCGGPVRPLLPTAALPQPCPGCPWHGRASSATTGALGARAGTAESPPVSATRLLLAAIRSPQSCPHRVPAITIGLPQSHLRVPDATQEPLPPKSHYRDATTAKGEQSLTSSHRWHYRAATKATIIGPPSQPQRHHCHNRAATATIGSPQSHHCHRTTTKPLAEATTTKLSPASASQGCQPLGLFTVKFMYP